ncbi:MAG: hypothetical protein JO297_04090 [Nitrososphaeraceae archaeon]|nr:hypothetical protein [Nitrososphaeraceae archaeon]
MERPMGIAIIILTIALLGMTAIAVNYNPAPAHAVKDTCKFVAPPHQCFSNRHDCEHYASSVGVTCAKTG